MKARLLFLLAFVEGAAVMAVELLGAKIIAPFYGASLIVWSAVIGVTLISLTLGYFIGGRIANHNARAGILYYILMLAAFFIALMPVIGVTVLYYTYSNITWVIGATVTAALILLGPPLLLLGTTSPVIIQLLTRQVDDAGKNAGRVYALSTIGGIGATFLFGFFIIPTWGIRYPVMILALLLLLFTAVVLHERKRWRDSAVFLILFVISASYYLGKKGTSLAGKHVQVIHEEEGLLGQLRVVDAPGVESGLPERYLTVNSIPQTYIINDSARCSYWTYVHIVSAIASLKKRGGQALLLGFGGGSLVNELTRLGFDIEAIEIDRRMYGIARQYFGLDDTRTRFIVDDARHYIKTTDQAYDLIILDLGAGEVQPFHLFSLECFREIRGKLTKKGLLLINYQGYVQGEKGFPFRSIYKTLTEADLHTYYWSSYPEAFSDLIITASPSPVDFDRLTLDEINPCGKKQEFMVDFIAKPVSDREVALQDAVVLRDDRPLFEQENIPVIMEWRLTMIQTVAAREIGEGIPLFK